MSEIRTLKQIDTEKKRALVRVDYNISEKDTWRIETTLPTLKYLIRQKAKIILISHLGRPASRRLASASRGGPNGKRVKKYSLKPVAEELKKLLRKKIQFSEQIIGWSVEKKIERMKFGDVLMLENIRFHSGEENNSPRLAKDLAKLGNVFINDAFAVSHREHASITGIPDYLPSAAGFLFEKEIKELDKILKNPQKPLIAIIGGAKIATKIKVINKFLKIADKVLIGGALANDIFAAQGISMGESLIDKESFSEVKKLDLGNPRFFLPVDLYAWSKEGNFYREINEVQKKEKVLDIGLKTIDLFCNVIKNAETIVWNGPLGLFTKEPFDKASKAVVEAISKSRAYSIAGGGDTMAFIRSIKKEKTFNYLSTAGGAMLDYLANGTLPGIEALLESDSNRQSL